MYMCMYIEDGGHGLGAQRLVADMQDVDYIHTCIYIYTYICMHAYADASPKIERILIKLLVNIY